MKRSPRRRWHLDANGFRRVGSKNQGFGYVDAGGVEITDEKVLQRIRSLRIPPAWTDVRIARSETAPLQAVGVDKKGRTQYLYHARFRSQRDDEKFQRIVRFGESLPRLRRRVKQDLSGNELSRERVIAAIVRLIDQGFFRVGNDKSARFESTYGLTTITSNHVKTRGAEVLFDFIGKWQKTHKKKIDDREVAQVIRDLQKLDSDELFQFRNGKRLYDVKDRHVNEYIQAAIGEDYTAKDFRTWAGTLLCSIALAMQGQAVTKKERKRRVKSSIEATANLLGNTPAVCRSSYICPRLIDEYMEGRPFESLRKSRKTRPVAKVGLSAEERALLKFFRETIANRRRHSRAA